MGEASEERAFEYVKIIFLVLDIYIVRRLIYISINAKLCFKNYPGTKVITLFEDVA
jgi:hypothetical protein